MNVVDHEVFAVQKRFASYLLYQQFVMLNIHLSISECLACTFITKTTWLVLYSKNCVALSARRGLAKETLLFFFFPYIS